MVKYYTGIGSRETPIDICELMILIAEKLSRLSYRLRSGHADGADYAFETGSHGDADIYLPWPTFGKDRPVFGRKLSEPEAWTEAVAAEYHPAWKYLKFGARKLHMRNVHQILGDKECQVLSEFVICWTPGASGSGGTGQAIRIAKAKSIPVFDLADRTAITLLNQFISVEDTQGVLL